MAYASTLPDERPAGAALPPRVFAWSVFALTFGLLISDYMSRQVLNAVFPLLKSEWQLSDARLGLLSGIVALMVGLLTFPLSLLADRWGRVKSLVLMAALWSVATMGCALAQNYQEMFVARFFVGVGEAAYGSVGIAVVLSVFPRELRSTLTGAFMAGGMFGSVLGMALGGAIAAHVGWRWSFGAMALFGLALAVVYPLVVRPSSMGYAGAPAVSKAQRPPLASLFQGRALRAAYAGSGLQLFAGGACIVWMPSYLNRYYGLDAGRAGIGAAVLVLASGAGMILCGMLSDRLARGQANRKVSLAAAYGIGAAVLLGAGFLLPPGPLQLALVGCGMFVAAGASGPAGAMVANLTPAAMHGTAFATLTLANNLLGLAPGPFVTGALADRIGLDAAFRLVPLASLAAACVFLVARRYYDADAAAIQGEQA